LRVRVAFLVVLLFSFAIIGKILYIQFVEGDKWRRLAVENLVQFRKVKATRGNIYSDNGSLLATSIPFYKVAIDPRIADEKIFRSGIDSLSRLLSAFFKDKSSHEYKKKIMDARAKKDVQYLVLNRKMINFQAKKEMMKWPIFREGRAKGGVIFEKVDKRFRPFSYLAMRTVGFINEENKGAGLEYSFQRELGGVDGEALFLKIPGGHWKPLHDESEVRPKQGVDIQTTININMQDVAESSLMRHLTAHDADYGCVVLMEVATGEIKAIANLGKQAPGVYVENYNYAVGNQGLTDPGSTFKLASVIALFEDSNIELEDSVETGNGTFEFYDRIMTDSKPEGHGTITFLEAFEKSSNIGISRKVNEHFGLKPQKFIDYIHSLGLAEPIGFQMHGEAKPFIKKPTDKSWSGISLPWMSIGYELKISPLQTLMLYNAVANNGKMIKPIIVKETKVADKTLKSFKTEVVREKICSDKTLAKVRKMLEGVVERGTASNINNTIYKIAGKTGTAQKIKNGQYIKEYYCSFAGYFPADKPKYSCIVVIDSPKGYKKYGSDVAAPVFKEIADKIYASDLDLHKPIARDKVTPEHGVFPVIKSGYHEDLNYLCNELGISNHSVNDAEEWVVAKAVNNAVMWQQKEQMQGTVPDGLGLTLRDAYYVFENAGLRVKHAGHGRVSRQSISPGSRLVKGSTIYIELE